MALQRVRISRSRGTKLALGWHSFRFRRRLGGTRFGTRFGIETGGTAERGTAERDVLAGWGESLPGRPLLRPVMRGGKRVASASQTLEEIRARAAEEIAKLPERLRGLEAPEPPYPVEVSEALRDQAERLRARLEGPAQ